MEGGQLPGTGKCSPAHCVSGSFFGPISGPETGPEMGPTSGSILGPKMDPKEDIASGHLAGTIWAPGKWPLACSPYAAAATAAKTPMIRDEPG